MAATIIPATFIKVGCYKHNDSDQQMCVFGIELKDGIGIATAYKVTRRNEVLAKWAFTEFGKADSVSCIVFDSGTLRAFVSQADAPGASGSTSAVRVYDVVGAFPPAVVASTNTNTTDAFIRLHFKNFLIGLRDLANKFISSIP